MKSRNPVKQRALWLVAGVVSVSLLLLGVSSCKQTTNQTPGEQLVKASKDAGVNIHADEVFTMSRGAETITGAPIVGWEQIPATAHANGVEFGYAYISTEEPRIPAGHYKLKGFARPSQVGPVEGRVQLIDQGGRVAAEIPAQVEVHSMTVPAEAAGARSFVTAVSQGDRNLIWFRCPNGVCFRMLLLRPRLLPTVHQG